jgi:signal transduction histidine kinase
MSLDVPVGVAIALIFPPGIAGLAGLICAFDLKEFTREITVTKTIFNRSQTALAYLFTSMAVHAVASNPGRSSAVLPLSFLALLAATMANYAIVSLALTLEYRTPLDAVVGKLRLGTPVDYAVSAISWAVLGAMLAIAYDKIGIWALAAFVAPTLLTRQVLLRSQMVIDTARAYRSREAAMAQVGSRVFEERRDERRLIAADLHDEVLQPLFKVTLMANVLKADLATGRLLELDQDLPELITAAELAAATLRELIGDLRQSALGRGDLPPLSYGSSKACSSGHPFGWKHPLRE